MSDNLTTQSATPATIPASTTIATDDAGAGGHVQVVKLAVSTNGSATPLTADNTDGLLVNLGTNNDVTISGTAAISAASLPLPSGASTAANQSTANTALAAIQTAVETLDNAISGSEMQVDVLTMPTVTVNSHAVTNAGTFAVQVDGAALTSLQLADDVVATLGTSTYAEATTKGTVVGAVRRDADTTLVDTTNEIGPLQMDANGRLKVEVFSGETLPVSLTSTTVTGTVAVTQSGTWDEVGINDSGNSITVDNGGTFAVQVDGTALTRLTDIETNTDSGAVVGNGAAATAQRVTLANDSTGIVALTTSTASIGKLAANSGVDIGDVDITSIAAGDNNIGNVDIVTMPNVTLAAGTNTNEVVGDIAHDTGVGGNPVQIAGEAKDMDDTAPPNQVSAESDTTRLATDRDGALFTHPHGPRIWSYHLDTSTAQTDTSVHSAPASGLSLYVTDIVFSSDGTAAINLFFEEGASKVLGPYYLPATAGGIKLQFATPKKITAATALTLTTSASQPHSVDITGFTGQG